MATKENQNVIKLATGFLFLLGFLFVINPLSRGALAIYLFLTVITITIYAQRQYQSYLIGIGKKNLGVSMIFAIFLGAGFYFATKIIPGLSFGLPLLPAAISDSLKFFIIVGVAPVIETIAIQGALYGYVRSFSPSRKQVAIAILIQALFFSLLHLGAYISGFYQLPTITAGLSAVSANISAFIAAFIFALIAGIIVVQDGIKNLVFVGLFHLVLNFILYTVLTVAFA